MVNDEQLSLQSAEAAVVPPNRRPWERMQTIPRQTPALVVTGRQWNHRCPSMENAEVHILHLHTAFRDLVHRWECCGLSNGERFQHRIINNMKNFAHTTYAHGNGMLHTLLLICRSKLLFFARTTRVLPSFLLISPLRQC
jgi:hypothetical protein